MKKRLFVLFLAAILVVAFAGCAKEDPSGKAVIKVETRGSPSPFVYTVDAAADAVYTTKDGVYLSGYDVAVLVELFKLPEFADYELDLTVNSNALVDTQQGIIDATVNNWSYNAERAETYLFTYPYTKSRYTITAAAGQQIGSFEELADSGLVVYGSAGSNTTNAIERWNEKRTAGQSKIKVEYTSVDITIQLQEAIEGKIALIHDQPVILKYKNAYPAQFANLTITVLSDDETAANITANNTSHILLGKTGSHAKEYQKLFSEGIKKLYENGTLAEIGKKWIADVLGDENVSVLPLESDLKYLN